MKNETLMKYTKWLSVLSFLGAAISLYLTYLHLVPEASSICQLGETFDCDVVNKSVYSELFGVPVSILGAGYYITMLVFSVLFSWKNSIFAKTDLKDMFGGLLVITLIGLGFALYLTGVEAFILNAYCIFCLAQQIIIIFMSLIMFRSYRITSSL